MVQGPIGFKPLPALCRMVTDKRYLTDDELGRLYRLALHGRLAVIRRQAAKLDYVRSQGKFPPSLFVVLRIHHLSYQLSAKDQLHDCWDEGRYLELSCVTNYLYYWVYHGAGAPADPVLEAAWTASWRRVSIPNLACDAHSSIRSRAAST